MLPADQAKASAVAYLYARTLDSYEDLTPEPAQQRAALGAYAARFGVDPPGPAPATDALRVTDDRDRAHVLLARRISLVDEVFSDLSVAHQQSIVKLIAAMADGMMWGSRTIESQGGVLTSAEQRSRYCRYVMGQPALFVLRLTSRGGIDEAGIDSALMVSEMVQMANITRDIERDLARGVAYHEDLLPWLGQPGSDERDGVIAAVRRELLVEGLVQAPAFRGLMRASGLPAFSRARGSAILMLLFTERHYRATVERVGGTAWPGSDSSAALYSKAMVAGLSGSRADAIAGRVEAHFLAAADELMTLTAS
jgi:phytoene/squalene synthetase